MASARRPERPKWLQAYLDQLPGVAGSLTTAAILFAAAVFLQPTISRLFSTPDASYPIVCSADPVGFDPAHNRALAAFFVVNRTNYALTAEELRDHLRKSLNREVGLNGVSIKVSFGPYDGKFLSVKSDRVFNDDKGEASITVKNNEFVISIVRIEANAILKFDVAWEQDPLPSSENITRDTKGALPFGQREYERACYLG